MWNVVAELDAQDDPWNLTDWTPGNWTSFPGHVCMSWLQRTSQIVSFLFYVFFVPRVLCFLARFSCKKPKVENKVERNTAMVLHLMLIALAMTAANVVLSVKSQMWENTGLTGARVRGFDLLLIVSMQCTVTALNRWVPFVVLILLIRQPLDTGSRSSRLSSCCRSIWMLLLWDVMTFFAVFVYNFVPFIEILQHANRAKTLSAVTRKPNAHIVEDVILPTGVITYFFLSNLYKHVAGREHHVSQLSTLIVYQFTFALLAVNSLVLDALDIGTAIEVTNTQTPIPSLLLYWTLFRASRCCACGSFFAAQVSPLAVVATTQLKGAAVASRPRSAVHGFGLSTVATREEINPNSIQLDF